MKDNPTQNPTPFFTPAILENIRREREVESKKEQEKYIERMLELQKDRLRQSLALDYSMKIGRSWRPAKEDRTTICTWFEKNGLKCEKDVHVYLENDTWTFRLKPSFPLRLKTIWYEFWFAN